MIDQRTVEDMEVKLIVNLRLIRLQIRNCQSANLGSFEVWEGKTQDTAPGTSSYFQL